MSTDILPFQFESQQVRVINIDGEPWFVTKDVMAILELSNPTETVRGLDEDEFTTTELTDSLGRNQQTYILSEPGLYSLIVRSRKAQAKPFRRWVTHDVIPSIRRTGQYGNSPELTGPALYLAAIEQATAEIAALETRNAQLEPKAARFDDYLSAKGDYTFTAAAKILQRDHNIEIGSRRLIQTLINWGWVYRAGRRGSIQPYQAQLETKRLALRATTYMNQDSGEMVAGDPQTRVTPKGVVDIAERLTSKAVA